MRQRPFLHKPHHYLAIPCDELLSREELRKCAQSNGSRHWKKVEAFFRADTVTNGDEVAQDLQLRQGFHVARQRCRNQVGVPR